MQKFFGCINNDQLPNEQVLHINYQEGSVTLQQTEKKKLHFLLRGLCYVSNNPINKSAKSSEPWKHLRNNINYCFT